MGVKPDKTTKDLEQEIVDLKARLNDRSRMDAILAEAFASNPDSITVADIKAGKILVVNQATVHLAGYTQEEWTGAHPDKFDIWVDKKERDRFFNWLRHKDKHDTFKADLIRKDGSRFVGLITGDLIYFGDEMLSVTTIRDITELETAKKKLQDSNNKFTMMFQASYAPLMLLAAEPRRIIDINTAAIKLLGYDKVTEGQELANIWVHQEDRIRFAKALAKTGSCIDFETLFLSATGRHIPVIASGKILNINNEDCIMFHLQDLTLQKLSEAQLLASSKRLEIAQEIARVGDFVLDVRTGTLTTSNEFNNLLKLANLSEKFDLSMIAKLIHPDDLHKFQGAAKITYDVDFRLHHPVGPVEWLHLIANITRNNNNEITKISGVVQDITNRVKIAHEQENLRKQMLQTQKLESLGVLAGGIAHDFNNLLTSILGNADLALVSLDNRQDLEEHLGYIVSASHRAADLTHQLLAYSGQGKFLIEKLDIRSLIIEMGKLLTVSINKNSHLVYELHEDLPAMMGDKAQIQQIIMNLIINASEALEGEVGEINISTGIDQNFGYQQDDFIDEMPQPGPQIYFEVQDTGVGMSQETLERIFEPFFTTKFTGRGLGMAAVLGIIRGHHGAIKLDSVEFEGTTLRILFPYEDIAHDPSVGKEKRTLPEPSSETILVVDDEEIIRKVIKRMLQAEGYQTLEASDGNLAIDILQNHGSEIDLVILDLTMPNMDGQETFRRIRDNDKKIKVILMSGYSEQEADRQLGDMGDTEFIAKPFDHLEMIHRVAKVLNKKDS